MSKSSDLVEAGESLDAMKAMAHKRSLTKQITHISSLPIL